MDIESLREIVKKGKFHAFPKELLNQEFLSQKNNEGHNFSMLAVIHKHIKSAPPEFLTKELLLQKDDQGFTCLHMAATQADLDKLPKELIKKEFLSIKDSHGMTVYALAAACWDLEAIPSSQINEKVILQKDNNGKNALDHAFYPFGGDDLIQAPILLKFLSDKTLEKLSKQYSRSWFAKAYGRRLPYIENEINRRKEKTATIHKALKQLKEGLETEEDIII